MLRNAAAAVLLAAAVGAGGSSAAVQSDVACSLNGALDAASSTCRCRPAWRGRTCAELALQPATKAFQMPGETSTAWGAAPIRAPSGRWHAFVAVYEGGLGAWNPASRIVHVRAAPGAGADGPYTLADVVLGRYHCSPAVLQVQEGGAPLYVLYSSGSAWGNGTAHDPPAAYNSSGVFPGAGTLVVSTSRSLDGPWNTSQLPRAFGSTGSGANPSVLRLNSSGFMLTADTHSSNGGAFTAPTYRGPWTPTDPNCSGSILTCGACKGGGAWTFLPNPNGVDYFQEDHRLYQDGQGDFHVLNHAMSLEGDHSCCAGDSGPSCNESLAAPSVGHTVVPTGYADVRSESGPKPPSHPRDHSGGHLFATSPSGPWHNSPVPPYTSNISWKNGATSIGYRRERPYVILGQDGDPLWLFNGLDWDNGTSPFVMVQRVGPPGRKSDDTEPSTPPQSSADAAVRRYSFAPSGASVLNPMRGFRHQIDGFCGDPRDGGHKPASDPTGAKAVVAGLKVCHGLNLTVTLAYCYLSPWWNTSLTATMLANLDANLGAMRAGGVSVLLNFAYEDGKTNYQDDVEPFSFDQIYAHIDQLVPVVRHNADVVYGLQAGFIGNAGEWAHDIRHLLTNATGMAGFVSRLLYGGLLPPDRFVLIRKGEEKLHLLQETQFAHCENDTAAPGHTICNGVTQTLGGAQGLPVPDPRWQYGVVDSASAQSQAAFARLGKYNAGFMSTAGDGGTFKPDDERSVWFAYFTREAPFIAVDGECYYGTPWPAKQRLLVEGHAAAARMTEHSFNTFSHHNSFWPLDDEATPTPQNKSINVWMQERLDGAFLREQRLPITEAYEAESNRTNGSIYEYIRDHLGYRLELSDATVSASDGSALTVSLTLFNRGFAAPVNVRNWSLGVLDAQDKVVRTCDATGGTDWRRFYSYVPGDPLRAPLAHVVTLAAECGPLDDSHSIGVALTDPLAKHGTGISVRFINTPFVSEMNVLRSTTTSWRLKSDDARHQPAAPVFYAKLAGVIPVEATSGRNISVGANSSLAPCVAVCDATESCEGFTVNTWATAPPASCRLFSNATALVDAPCDAATAKARAAQLAAAFVKPVAGTAVPYQQWAGLMSPLRAKTAATIAINHNFSMCVEACDADPLCVGFQLAGCSPDAPGPECWTMHAASVPSLEANVLDAACYYSKPGSVDIPAATPTANWTCGDACPHSAGCPKRPRVFDSGWSNGTASFNCKMRRLAWEFGQHLRPDYKQFADLYYALGLNDDCKVEVPPPQFSAADWAPAVPSFAAGTGTAVFFVDSTNGLDTNTGASIESPKRTIHAAVLAAAGKAAATINLRGGRHYVAETVQLTSAHSGLTIQNYNGERAVVSGGVQLTPHWSPHKLASGITVHVADVSSAGLREAPGLHVDGVRTICARYPDGNPELPERGLAGGNADGSVWIPGTASIWIQPDPSINQSDCLTVTNSKKSQAAIGGVNGEYSTYTMGYGGWCKIYEPPNSYWCSSHRAGGGAHAPVKPRGVTPPTTAVSPPGGNATAGLHLPYRTLEGAIIQAWHDDRWANWMWEVAGYDDATRQFTFGRGGFQESRGSGSGNGGGWLIENVFEELDSPGEYFFNRTEQRLYYYHNSTNGQPPANATFEVPTVRTLINLSASRWDPIRDVRIRGLTLTATRTTFMDPHGIPSAGDFAVVRRSGAVFLEGTERVTISDCNLTRLDGNGIVVSGSNRDANISHNTISWIGDNGIVIWGRTNETAADPMEGFDGTDGNHPRMTRIEANVIREIGIYTKQTGWVFQAKAALTHIEGNIMFNAPRNGLTFNDAFGGGDVTTRNLMFSALRESSDGGTWNSWNRQPFLTTYRNGKTPSQYPAWREVSYNLVMNNYHGLVPLDADDGTSWLRMHHNFVSGGAWGMKNFFGHDKYFGPGNVNVFPWNNVVDIATPYLPGHADRYFNNTVLIRDPALTAMRGTDFSHHCSGGLLQMNITNTKVFSGTGAVNWVCPNNSGVGNTVAKLPTEDDMIALGRSLLFPTKGGDDRPAAFKADDELVIDLDKPTNAFEPDEALGSSMDILPRSSIDTVYSPTVVEQCLSAGWGPISYRQNTEQTEQNWHWNSAGVWSDAERGEGYFLGSLKPTSAQLNHSFGYTLPHRGNTNNYGAPGPSDYSRLTDGDLSTYWKSSPYLASHFTKQPDAAHPAWVILDLGEMHKISTLRIHWSAPYATAYSLERWSVEDDPCQNPLSGTWRRFPGGTITNGTGGLVDHTVDGQQKLRFIRILMTASSQTCSSHGSSDVRNCVGYAIAELEADTLAPNGSLIDVVKHAPKQDTQSGTYCSSTDPWHRASDIVPDQIQTGFDLFFRSGITGDLPAMLPTGLLYSSSPEDSAALIDYVLRRGYKLEYVEIGEEADGEFVSPETYGELYLQWASAIHAKHPEVKLGGPSFTGTNSDIKVWPDEQGRTSWLGRFVDYLRQRGRLSDLAFMSYEHYPYEPGDISWDDLYREADLVSGIVKVWREAGLPESIPQFITESDLAAGLDEMFVDIFSGLWLADFVGAFMNAGGARVHKSPIQPEAMREGEKGWATWGNFVANDDLKIQQYTAMMHVSRLINLVWVTHGAGVHAMYNASCDARDADGNVLVTAYAVLRPDGNHSVMIVNKDQHHERSVSVRFQSKQHSRVFASRVEMDTYGAEQYQWHNLSERSHADPDKPPVSTVVDGGERFILPKASVTVLRGVLKTDDAPPGFKALLVGASDSRGSVLRPPNLTLTRPGALWNKGGSAGFQYNQTYRDSGSYALRFDMAQPVCVSAVDSCTGGQAPAGPTAGPVEPGIGETHASIALLPNHRYIMIAVIRTSFERLTTEINLGVNLFDEEGNGQTDYERVVGLPSDSRRILASVDGWVRWQWEFVTPSGVARGVPFFAEYLRNGTTTPRLEVADLAFVLTPATALKALPGASGVMFRGSAGALPMSVEACSVAGAVTTAANYTWSSANGTVQQSQNIDMTRRLAEWKLSVPLTGLQVLSFVSGPAGRCVVGNAHITIGVQVDGLVGFVPQAGNITLTLTNLFGGNFNRVGEGHLLSEDDYGGITVTPTIPLGSGRLARWSMVTQGLAFAKLNATDTNSTETLAPGWQVSWQLSVGERLFSSVMPTRPYDWVQSFDFSWDICGTEANCRANAAIAVPNPALYQQPTTAYVMWHAAAKVFGSSSPGPYMPYPNASAVRELVGMMHSTGKAALPYMSAAYHSTRNATEYIGHVKQWKDEFGIDGICECDNPPSSVASRSTI